MLRLLAPSVLIIATVMPCYADDGAVTAIRAKTYYGKSGADADSVDIPVRPQTINKLTLFDKVISYRNNKKAHVDFELPVDLVRHSGEMEIELEAYNDDAQYARAVWFEVDGTGGYIGVTRVADEQYRGRFVLGAKQRKRWRVNLSKVYLSSENQEQVVNFYNILKQPGVHTMSCWVSTYEQYGPDSRVSVDLLIKESVAHQK